nr:MAG TPA: hypothetical protein [Caudoviricetes sp.]
MKMLYFLLVCLCLPSFFYVIQKGVHYNYDF